MAITIDVLTHLDERSLAASARTVESALSSIGGAGGAGTKALEGLHVAQQKAAESAAILAAAQKNVAHETSEAVRAQAALGGAFRQSLHMNNLVQFHKEAQVAIAAHEAQLASLSAAQDAYFSSLGSKTAIALGGVAALSVGILGTLADIGEHFQNINRAVVTSTGASGSALQALNSNVRDVMNGVDTSVKSIGSDIGVLSNRLQLVGGDPALTTLTKHVEELRDRFGGLDVRTLTGDFVQFGIAGKDADSTLASIMNTSMATSVPLNELLTTVQNFGETLQEAGLNIEQSTRLVGKMDEVLGTGGATKAMTGFAHAEADAAKRGESFQQFLVEAAGHIQTFTDTGNQAAAQDLSEKIFGTRNWPQAKAIFNEFLDIQKRGADAFKAQGSDIDDLSRKTKDLGNYWSEVRNKISSALAPPGQTAIGVVEQQMDRLVSFVDAHKDSLRRFFEVSATAIGAFVQGLGAVASYLGRTPELVEAVGVVFVAWKAYGIITGITKAILAMNVALGASEGAAAAGAAGLAGLSAMAVPLVGVLGALAVSIGNIIRGAQKGYDWYMGHSALGLLTGHPPHEGEDNAPAAPGAGAPHAPSFYNQWYPPSGPATGPLTPGEVRPGVPVVPGAPGGDTGDAQAFLDSLGPGGGGKGKKGPRLPGAPEVPYGPGFSAPPGSGESEQHYAARGSVMEAEHKVAEDQARLNQLEHANNATAEDIQKARNKLDEDVRHEQEARGRLQDEERNQLKKHVDGMEQLGAKIDQDFGISKGLPGIAENLFKFLANLAAAPITGAANAWSAAYGGPTGGGKGLIGAAALAGMSPEQLAGLDGSGSGSGGSQGFGPGGQGGQPSLGGAAGPLPGVPGSPNPGGPSYWWAPGTPGKAGSSGAPIPGSPGSSGTPIPGTSPGPGGQQGASLEAWISQAEAAAGVDASWTPGLKTLIQRESGGNPNAINNWDSNAAAGHPSQGLMQTIPGTFGAHHVPGTSESITDPVANIAAGIRYIQSRYGGIQGVQQANPNMPAKGYYLGGEILSFAAGGDIAGSGAIPILAHEGEHVLTKSDVAALGGHDGVYKMRSDLHQSPTMQYLSDASSDKSGPQSPIPKELGPKILPPGVMSAMPKVVQGGYQPGPSMIGTVAPPSGYGAGFAITGGGLIGLAESLPSTAASMGMMGAGAAAEGGAVDDQMGGMPGGTAPAMPAPPPPPPAPPPPAAMAAPGGSSAGGAKASGGSPSGSISSALIGIGIQEMNAAIGAAGQAVGAGVGGLMQTFGPGQFAQSKLAQSGWVNKVIGGITGAQPQLPNMAGQTHQSSTLTPEQAAEAGGGAQRGGGGAPGPGGPSGPQIGTGINIENYQVMQTEDKAGKHLAGQLSAYLGSTNAQTGSR